MVGSGMWRIIRNLALIRARQDSEAIQVTASALILRRVHSHSLESCSATGTETGTDYLAGLNRRGIGHEITHNSLVRSLPNRNRFTRIPKGPESARNISVCERRACERRVGSVLNLSPTERESRASRAVQPGTCCLQLNLSGGFPSVWNHSQYSCPNPVRPSQRPCTGFPSDAARTGVPPGT